jgi:hypothetical protein
VACPFWEGGGAVLRPGGALERLGLTFEQNPRLAHWLLTIRNLLTEARTAEQQRDAYRLFDGLLPPGLRD